ncbi:MAG: methyltransferase domain-containing protein [Planctomycetes bacterium]|nr:methyltransferase domain-containing protein [Planctomycetota bacterium]
MSTPSVLVNYWRQSACARAFWGQQEVPAYRELLVDTKAWLNPRPGERWLDLGCGCGKLTQALWEKSGGELAQVIGIDCAAENDRAFRRLRAVLTPAPTEGQFQFLQRDFSAGLSDWTTEHFDGVVSGLAIHYAESYSPERGCWTTEAYDRLLGEVFRVLRGDGSFVFSVIVPEPAWGKLAWHSWPGVFSAVRPLHFLKRAWRMMSYGPWLKQQARRGRFHYLPLETIARKLTTIGFGDIQHRLSYAGQAYLIRCHKPA